MRPLPAAVVVILAVLAGTWLILPQGRWPPRAGAEPFPPGACRGVAHIAGLE